MDKTLYRNLASCGGIPEIAADSFKEFTLAQYTDVAKSEEFRKWFDSYIADFNSFFDGVLIGDLFYLRKKLYEMSVEADQYSRVWSQYIKLIDRTAPIVDRMKKYAAQNADGPATGDKITLVDETPQA
jgi:hypothetical protein